MEEPLLSDTDRPYDLPDYGGMGKAVGKGAAEQGAEAPEVIGVMERGTAERMHDGRKSPGQIRMVNSRLKGGEDKIAVTTGQVNEQTSRKAIAFFQRQGG